MAVACGITFYCTCTQNVSDVGLWAVHCIFDAFQWSLSGPVATWYETTYVLTVLWPSINDLWIYLLIYPSLILTSDGNLSSRPVPVESNCGLKVTWDWARAWLTCQDDVLLSLGDDKYVSVWLSTSSHSPTCLDQVEDQNADLALRQVEWGVFNAQNTNDRLTANQ